MKPEDFKNMKINMPNFDLRTNDLLSRMNNVGSLNRSMNEISEMHRKKNEREEEFKDNVLALLQGIEKNTGGIADLVKLVHSSNEKQDQVIELLSEIMSISAAKTKEEAETKFQKALGKIQSLGTTVESVQTLIGLLNTVYNSVQPLLKDISF
ncbi:hypothetical protein [Paenibacillus xylanexedens]|uniref:hypothetical protein n=1 Tax=Paenibacillus xylanexedens TaxID=528191 RepID=UPI001C8E0581|nr:hypothetical protein [Paenibacillus xylanexedens]MBY0117871.1 hypothetical protein [Paenibacillus xylanexedens]